MTGGSQKTLGNCKEKMSGLSHCLEKLPVEKVHIWDSRKQTLASVHAFIGLHFTMMYRNTATHVQHVKRLVLCPSGAERPCTLSTPFRRIAMDIVEPLGKSSAGHQYILMICDYATMYSEAFPLRSINTTKIIQALVQLFSRVGIPEEILTDQGKTSPHG